MAYTETTTTGYGTRVKNSFGGIVTGFVMFCLATALLWWNEGRAVKTDKMLNEAEKVCVVMENPQKKDAALDGELVCATAVATTEDSLVDNQYGIGAKAISLQRRVEYYQWTEESESKSEDKLGGKEVTTTTYTYKRDWVREPVASDEFKDPAYRGRNFVLTTVEESDQWAGNVTFGAYTLNESLIHRISSVEDMVLDIDSARIAAWNKEVALVAARQSGEEPDSQDRIHVSGNQVYYGLTPSSPAVGDVRVTFEKVVPAKVTLISQVDGETFKPFKSKNGKRFQTLVMGKKDAAEIFEAEHETNNMWLWVLRILGVLFVIGGLKSIFGIFETLLKVVPFLSSILGWGVGLVCTVVGIVWSIIIIALAWLFYRPLLGIGLLAGAAFLIWLFAFKGKSKLKELAAANQRAEAEV